VELFEKLIPDLANIVTDHLGTGIFLEDIKIFPESEWVNSDLLGG